MRRSRAVDALRGTAVLLVLWHHMALGSALDGSAWLAPLDAVHRAGFLGVSLFLVLSGFSIHLRVASGQPLRPGKFLLRRLVRLHPTYLAALVIATAVYGATVAAGGRWPMVRWGLSDGLMPAAVLIVVQLTVVAGTILPPGWLAVAWSLALEEHLYLLYAAGARWMRRYPPLTWLAVGLLATLLWRAGAMLLMPVAPKSLSPLAHESTWVATLLYQQAPARLFEWLLGAFAAQWYVGSQRLPRPLTWRPTAAVAILGLWWLFEHRSDPVSLLGHPTALTDLVFDPAAGIAFFLLLCASLAAEQRRAAPRLWRFGPAAALEWVGERSYSLYLVHLPIMVLAFQVAAVSRHALHASATVTLLAGVAMTVTVALAVAAALYRLVELPSTVWSRNVGRSRRPEPSHPDAQPADAQAADAQPADAQTAARTGDAQPRSAAGSSRHRYAAASAPRYSSGSTTRSPGAWIRSSGVPTPRNTTGAPSDEANSASGPLPPSRV